MSNPLNLYATKVFSEHPIALWALDDRSDYIAKITTENQNLDNWTVDGATIVDAKTSELFEEKPPREPFSGTYVNGAIEILDNGGVVTFESNQVFQPDDFNIDLGSFSISTYLFTYDRTVEVKIGYSYSNGIDEFEVIRSTTISPERQWAAVSQTFVLPELFEDLRLIIEISFTATENEYQFAIHGINLGQWSEEFNLESVGVFPEEIPSDIYLGEGTENLLVVPAQAYGFDGFRAYYMADSKNIYAKNHSLPMVFGATNSTVLRPNNNGEKPSMIFPGFGFLNESGKYQSLTFEFWAKIQNNSFSLRRIFGPIASDDGLYTEGPFFVLKIGENIASHYVGEWDRPMLIDLKYSPKVFSLIINGELAISIDISAETLSFPEKINDSYDQDWVGFYSYEDVPIIQLDCVGIYPYEVSNIVLKRRFVYGQAVELPTNINGLQGSNSVYLDKSFANDTKNYLYPLLGRWSNGFVENIIPNPAMLSLPSYSLPEVSFNNKTTDNWYEDLQEIQDLPYPFMSLKPNDDWDETSGHIVFNSLNNILEETKAVYGVFSFKEYSENKQTLFEMINERLGDSLFIYLEDNTIKYSIKTKQRDGSYIEEIFYTASDVITDAIFMAGIHIPRAMSSFGYKISRFFSNKQNIKIFVGGNSDKSQTFSGNIYTVSFCSQRNLSKIEDEFLITGMPVNFSDSYTEIVVYDGGTATTTEWPKTVDANDAVSTITTIADGGVPETILIATETIYHIATYSLFAKQKFNKMFLDIGADSYWEDYIPLSYFASYVDDAAGKKYQTLDFLHFNIDYPRFDRYDSNDEYNSSGSPIKIYATFQFLSNGSNIPLSSFANTKKLNRTGVVKPGTEWLTTKYEIVDDTIIYPPAGQNFRNITLNIHIDIQSSGIYSNPVKIRSMGVSSRSLGYSPNRIGNRFGTDIYPYRSLGLYSDYKIVSPFSIYKVPSPYLYLASNSGMRIRDRYATADNRGFTIPINKGFASFFKIGAMQIVTKYSEPIFPETPVQVFEVQSKDRYIKFYMAPYESSRTRAYIYAINGNTGKLEPGIIYNLNGKAVRRPVLHTNLWSFIGISFENSLDFSQSSGAFRITNPLLFNNISYYQITEREEAIRLAFRKWYAVRSEPDNELEWQDWDDSTWQEVLYLTQETPKVIDPADIYEQYVGINRIINSSDYELIFGKYEYKFFQDIRWSRITLNSA